jgi:hypothetical protein
MKIIQQESNSLVLKKDGVYPLLILLLILFLAPFLITPLFIILSAIPRQQTLNCTRTQLNTANCIIQEKVIIPMKDISVIGLTNARIAEEQESTESGDHKIYQIQLKSTTGMQDFGYSIEDKAEINEIAKKINFFLSYPTQNNLQVTQNQDSSVDLIMMLLFFSVWYLFIIVPIIRLCCFPNYVIWNFDKNLYNLTVVKSFLFNRKTRSEYSLADDFKLESISRKDSDGDTYCSLKLIIDSKKSLIISTGYHKTDIENLFNTIGNFLDWHEHSSSENPDKNESKKVRFKSR